MVHEKYLNLKMIMIPLRSKMPPAKVQATAARNKRYLFGMPGLTDSRNFVKMFRL